MAFWNTGKKLTDDQLKVMQAEYKAEPGEGVELDDVVRHFEFYCDQVERHWVEISNEGNRVLELITGDEVGEWSPADSVITGVAAASHHGAMAAVAAALGVDADDLERAVGPWTETNRESYPDERVDPVTPERLKALIDANAVWRNAGGYKAGLQPPDREVILYGKPQT